MQWDEYRYRVGSSRLVTPVITELCLDPESTVLPYLPGQYVLLNDPDFEVPQRSYSVANAPRPDGRVSLLVTRVPNGPTSTWVHDQLGPGDPVMLAGPYGTFLPDPQRTGPVLLLAAGSGLAPARALVESLLSENPENPENPPRPVTLYFSARTAADAIDHPRWLEWGRKQSEFRYLYTLTRQPGVPVHRRIPDLLPTEVGDLSGWEVFASGPSGFVAGCAASAQALGAEPAAIHTEEFFTDPQPWTGQPPPPTEPIGPR